MIIYDYIWLHMIIYDCIWLYIIIYYILLCIYYIHIYIHMNIYICIYEYEYIILCMTMAIYYMILITYITVYCICLSNDCNVHWCWTMIRAFATAQLLSCIAFHGSKLMAYLPLSSDLGIVSRCVTYVLYISRKPSCIREVWSWQFLTCISLCIPCFCCGLYSSNLKLLLVFLPWLQRLQHRDEARS